MLIAARSSQDLACCWRATASARSKDASALLASRFGESCAISPATRLRSLWMTNPLRRDCDERAVLRAHRATQHEAALLALGRCSASPTLPCASPLTSGPSRSLVGRRGLTTTPSRDHAADIDDPRVILARCGPSQSPWRRRP